MNAGGGLQTAGMSRLYPALDLIWNSPPSDDRLALVLVQLDDAKPIAVEEREFSTRIFFVSADARTLALTKLTPDRDFVVESVDVSDEDWAARSQASLRAVRVGRFVIAPPWAARAESEDVLIVIQPSMGFGTGHHATTRLCLQLLQQQQLQDAAVLDVGTGSGVLAIAAARLGAARVLAIDNDPDALMTARENIALNGAGKIVAALEASVADVGAGFSQPGAFDLVLANLTGAALVRHAPQLASAVKTGGSVIASGYGPLEERDVFRAFAEAGLAGGTRIEEDAWVCSRFIASPTPSTAR